MEHTQNNLSLKWLFLDLNSYFASVEQQDRPALRGKPISNAGIVTSRREGRSVIYSANFEVVRDLIGFMVKDCCSVEFASIREDKKKGCSIIELAKCC